MKTLFKIITIFTFFLFSNNLLAQPGRGVVKQPPRINGILKATNNATNRVKIHANSNTVIGTSKTHPNYDKKQAKKGELKEEEKEVAQKSKSKKK
jgi:hypothetical protein